MTRGGFTKIADALVRRGLAERIRSDQDRRVVLLCLTASGLSTAHERDSSKARGRVMLLPRRNRFEVESDDPVPSHS